MSDGERVSIAARLASWRERLRVLRIINLGYRIVIGVVGLVTLVVGIVAIPYPGPGWAIVFVGLAVLATEFDWARRLLAYARIRYDAAMGWFRRQGTLVQVLGLAFTTAIVVVTMWVFGVLDWAGERVNIEHEWLDSTIGIGG